MNEFFNTGMVEVELLAFCMLVMIFIWAYDQSKLNKRVKALEDKLGDDKGDD